MMATILVVDSQTEVVELVRARLQQDGHRVVSAADGPSALVAALTHPPDLVILDVTTPETNSFGLLRCLKNDARTAHLPVILSSAPASFASLAGAWGLDVENYVTKPYGAQELADLVQNALRSRGKIDS